ncbi:hypothetical protein EYF80_057935 [Liparis tanakae]|uniref:Uncharacterized protein n=1 Tax=Liparis tanakae TaxID=230148 RepID=A0A4Z2ESM0_9TELE|nr:hypothetical protein EYF80_057935 [Liparis tanakae]
MSERRTDRWRETAAFYDPRYLFRDFEPSAASGLDIGREGWKRRYSRVVKCVGAALKSSLGESLLMNIDHTLNLKT